MFNFLVLLFTPYIVLRAMGFKNVDRVYGVIIITVLFCSLGFVLASGLNAMFQDRAWFEALKAYHLQLYTNDFIRENGHRSMGYISFFIPIYFLIDVLRLYWLYAITFSTTITWVVNLYCWYQCSIWIKWFLAIRKSY